MRYGIRWRCPDGKTWVPLKYDSKEKRDEEFASIAGTHRDQTSKVRLLTLEESKRKAAAESLRAAAAAMRARRTGFEAFHEDASLFIETRADALWPRKR